MPLRQVRSRFKFFISTLGIECAHLHCQKLSQSSSVIKCSDRWQQAFVQFQTSEIPPTSQMIQRFAVTVPVNLLTTNDPVRNFVGVIELDNYN